MCLLEEKKRPPLFFLCSLCQNAWLLRLLQYSELFRSEPWCFFPTLKIEGKSSKVNRLHCVAVCLCIRCNEESVVASAPLLQNKKSSMYFFFLGKSWTHCKREAGTRPRPHIQLAWRTVSEWVKTVAYTATARGRRAQKQLNSLLLRQGGTRSRTTVQDDIWKKAHASFSTGIYRIFPSNLAVLWWNLG